MVSKTSVQEPKKTVKKPAPKKVSVKTAASKKTAVKSEVKKVEEKVLDKQVPVKENVNPVEQVLEIKAHNEEKKASKTAAKSASKKVSAQAAPVAEKENKTAVKREKVLEVKSTAQKAAARKLAELKADLEPQPKCLCAFCKNGAWAAWARAFKNIFNYKGRTSRYEFWSFMLINIFFVVIFGYGASLLFSTLVSLEIASFYLSVFMLVIFLVFLSLSVRRIHDIGYSAWNGFYRQLIFSIIAFVASIFLANFVYTSALKNGLVEEPAWLKVSVVACILLLVAFVLIICYYSTKIGIAVAYFENEAYDNKYGEALYKEEIHKKLCLRYATLFCVIVSVLYTLSLIIGIITGYAGATQLYNLM